MAYERWAKRMDDAVASAWLRGLRSPGSEKAAQPRVKATPRAKTSLRTLDRPVATAER